MATSGTITFSTTRDEIIEMAMKSIGKLGESQSATSEEVSDCAFFLNAMVKQWVAKADFAPGLKMWKRRRGTLFLSSTTGVYSLGPSGDHWTETAYKRQLTAASPAADTTLMTTIANASSGDVIGIVCDDNTTHWTTINGAPSGTTITITDAIPAGKNAASGSWVFNYTTAAGRPLNIETAVLRDTDDSDTPLNSGTLQDYDALPNKADADNVTDPTFFYYEPQLTNGTLYLDIGGANDATKRVVMTWLEPSEDFTNPTDEPEYPQQWYLALVWGLAKQICPMFNAPWTKEMETNFGQALAIAQHQDGETTNAYFQPGND